MMLIWGLCRIRKIKKDIYDISQFNQINETIDQRYELLNEELDAKEKEVFGLIGKVTKLVNKKRKYYLIIIYLKEIQIWLL